jgi:TPR repeat protein
MADPMIDKLRGLLATKSPKASTLYEEQRSRLDGDPIAQFEFARQAAILGLRDAVHFVVDCYQEGNGTEPDRTKAFEWLRKAAGGGKDIDIEFAFDLACCYRDGDGTSRDTKKFWEWMTKAAEQDDTEAMFQLAKAHLNPALGNLSPERADEWTRRMAEKGQPGALIQLARKYDDGKAIDKDGKAFLRYARQAVTAARAQWANRSSGGDWTYEDLPEALAVLADALRRNRKAAEASKRNREAAHAAWDAFCLARDEDGPVGQLLPEIMLRLLPELRGQKGELLQKHRTQYFAWLKNVRSAVDKIYFSTGSKDIPADLVQAIFDLAIAYRDGIGTSRQSKLYQECLREAAHAGHGQAAYLCALLHLKNDELLDFNQLITSAANANDMDAMIAQQLAAAGLASWSSLRPVLNAVQALRRTVVEIRDLNHKVDEAEASNGIAHYTNGAALGSMLAGSPLDGKNGVWLSSTVYVNDPTEGKRLRSYALGRRPNPLTELFNGAGETGTISWLDREFHVFIACFSLECDSLNLWRFYGDDGHGFSVVSPPSAFNANSNDGMIRGPWARRERAASKLALYKVLYEDKQVEDALKKLAVSLKPVLKIANTFGDDLGQRVRSVAIAVVSELLYLYKDIQYSAEREVRATEARTLGDPEVKEFRPPGMKYSRLHLETGALLFQEPNSQIIIGPKVEKCDAVMIDLQHQLARQNWAATCRVTKSAQNYR